MRHRSILFLLGFVAACGAEPQAVHAPEPVATVTAAAPMTPPAEQLSAAPVVSAAPEAKPVIAVDTQGCVTNPMAHAAQIMVSHPAAAVTERLGRAPVLADFEKPSTCFGSSMLPDVDGDGIEETQVVEGCSWGTQGALHLLYFSNRGCSRFAGDLVSAELSPLSTKAAGVLDLEATWSNGCAGNDFTWSHYRWDGKVYRVVDEATCSLCDDRSISKPPAGANKHAHCKAEKKVRER